MEINENKSTAFQGRRVISSLKTEVTSLSTLFDDRCRFVLSF